MRRLALPALACLCACSVRPATELVVQSGHTSEVTAVAFDPSGRYLLTGGEDRTARLWEIETGILLRVYAPQPDPVLAVAFDGGGKTVTLDLTDGSRWVRSAASGVFVSSAPAPSTPPASPDEAVSPDGRLRASGGGPEGPATVIETATGRAVFQAGRRVSSGKKVGFCGGERWLLTAGAGRTAWLWDLKEGRPVRAFGGHDDEVKSFECSEEGRRTVTVSRDGVVRAFAAEWKVRAFRGHRGKVKAVAADRAMSRAVSTGEDGTVRLWDLAGSKPVWSVQDQKGEVNAVAWPSPGEIVTGGDDGNLRWRAADTGRLLREAPAHHGGVHALAGAGEGRALSGGADGTAKLWTAKGGLPAATFAGHPRWVHAVAAAGGRAATASLDGTVRVWGLESGRIELAARGHSSGVDSVAFSPNGRLLASGGYDGTTVLWDPASGRRLASLFVFDDGSWLALGQDGSFDGDAGGIAALRETGGMESFPAGTRARRVPGLLPGILGR